MGGANKERGAAALGYVIGVILVSLTVLCAYRFFGREVAGRVLSGSAELEKAGATGGSGLAAGTRLSIFDLLAVGGVLIAPTGAAPLPENPPGADEYAEALTKYLATEMAYKQANARLLAVEHVGERFAAHRQPVPVKILEAVNDAQRIVGDWQAALTTAARAKDRTSARLARLDQAAWQKIDENTRATWARQHPTTIKADLGKDNEITFK